MATVLRATVMLTALVGLPAMWVYYGPLPSGAQRMVDRVVDGAKSSCGWDPPASQGDPAIAAPMLPRTANRSMANVAERSTPRVKVESNFSLVSSTGPLVQETLPTSPEETGIRAQLRPHLSLLRALGTTEYTLETWGAEGQLYRFRCEIPLDSGEACLRRFEAVNADPLAAVRQVVGEATGWQNARRVGGERKWR